MSPVSTTHPKKNPVKKHGQLHIDKTLLKDEHGNTLVLRGVSLGWHNWWPRFYNEEVVKWLYHDWNVNVVRAAMGVDPKDGYLKKPAWSKKKIETVVNAAIKQGIYVIIDWHCHHIRTGKAKTFFTEMALKYHRYPNIIYEIFNEPEYDSWKNVKKYSEEIIKTIRAIDKKNVILVGSPHWDQDIHLAANDPLKGYSNVMYSLHYYAASHKQRLRNRADVALQKGLPLFISECAGMEATGDGKINRKEWQKWIDWSEKNKISWLNWSIADKEETCSMLQATAASDGSWKINDLKESGILVRENLRKLNKN